VDLRGEDAARAFAAAAPLIAALAEAEPGVVVRSIAVDLSRPRVTATLDPCAPPITPTPTHPTLEHATQPADARPRVVRVDESPLLHRLLDASGPAVEMLSTAAAQALARRQG
jgi:hypothetical protein